MKVEEPEDVESHVPVDPTPLSGRFPSFDFIWTFQSKRVWFLTHCHVWST